MKASSRCVLCAVYCTRIISGAKNKSHLIYGRCTIVTRMLHRMLNCTNVFLYSHCTRTQLLHKYWGERWGEVWPDLVSSLCSDGDQVSTECVVLLSTWLSKRNATRRETRRTKCERSAARNAPSNALRCVGFDWWRKERRASGSALLAIGGWRVRYYTRVLVQYKYSIVLLEEHTTTKLL